MSATRAARGDRIELRATSEEKRLLVAAAAHERLDVTSFIMRNVLPVARESVGDVVLSQLEHTVRHGLGAQRDEREAGKHLRE